MSQSIGTLRAFSEVESIRGKKDPSARYAKQVCGLVKDGNRVTEFERFMNLENEQPLLSGDYDIVPRAPKLTRDGKLYVPFDLVPVSAPKKG
ncbi:MAG: hypothetical protein ACYCZD_01900 [Rhodanobacter sp.]